MRQRLGGSKILIEGDIMSKESQLGKRKRESCCDGKNDEVDKPLSKKMKLSESEEKEVGWLSDDKKAEKSKRLKKLYTEYISKRNEILNERVFSPPEAVKDYVFKNHDGKPIKLSQLFGGKKDLIIIHNMGVNCPFCTFWGDGFSGISKHIEDRAAFVMVSKDDIKTQIEFKKDRKWAFKMVSAKENSFTVDMNYEGGAYGLKPGVSTFYMKDNKIYRHARDSFGANDDYNAGFPLFRLLKHKDDKWIPKFKY